MKTTDILTAAIVFAEFDANRHAVQHDGLGLNKVRVGRTLYTRDEILVLLRAELLKLKEDGL